MKAKQIKKLLKGMIDNLCKSIKDPEIVEIIKSGSYITGGCIPSMLLDEYVNDFDIYLITQHNTKKIMEYYKNLKEQPEKFKVKLITENSINLSDKIQIITKFYGPPKFVINKFDWAHIKSYYCYPDRLILTDDVYKLIVEKDLIYTGSDYPLSSIMRLRKFIKKGWNVSNKTILNICLDLIQSFQNPSKKNRPGHDELLSNNKVYSDIATNCEPEYEHKFNVEEVLYHLNGVDPLTIQIDLKKKTGESLTIKEIIKLIK